MKRLLLFLTVLACSPQLLADEPDPIRKELDKAKKAHLEAVAKARSGLLTAFDNAIKTVAQSGDLDAVKALQSERKAFDEAATVPYSAKLRTAAGEYTKATKQSKAVIDRAYDQAVKDYTKDLQIELAEAIRDEHKRLTITGLTSDEATTPVPKAEATTTSKSGKLQILDAKFGAEDSWADVTQRVQKLVKDGKLSITLDGSISDWPDPIFGKVKVLILAYSVGGKVHVAMVGGPSFHGEFPEVPKKK